ncbi:MAG: DNA-directed RNA polymerase subunit omega [Victivallales bacterium]|nr:DNA-directed RNA polymerase subunit omega [Victivallales bacterium]
MSMNNGYLARAKQQIPDPQILSVVAAKRAKQLALGARPMVKCDSENYLDWALLEIAEGLLSYEFGTPGDAGSATPTLGAENDAPESAE